MAKILVLDVGNTNIKCFVYKVRGSTQNPKTEEIYSAELPTFDGHVYAESMESEARCACLYFNAYRLLKDALRQHPDCVCGIPVAFGDAFVLYGHHPHEARRLILANTPAPMSHTIYARTGFPEGYIDITGIKSLRASYGIGWDRIVPVNIFLGIELTAPGKWSDSSRWTWRRWDHTQASCSGEFDLQNGVWEDPALERSTPVCPPLDMMGIFRSNEATLPLMAGGLDNGFLDTLETTPYIMAGTWLVISQINKTFTPTEAQREHGVRWCLSANGNYLSQAVIKWEGVLTDAIKTQILKTFEILNITGDIRIYGGQSRKVHRELLSLKNERKTLNFINKDVGYESVVAYAYEWAQILGLYYPEISKKKEKWGPGHSTYISEVWGNLLRRTPVVAT